MSTTELILTLSIPGWVILLLAVASYELIKKKRHKNTVGTPLSATYVDEFTAVFYGSKRVELDNRASMSLLREENEQGAPPWLGIDLDNGIVHITPDDPDAEPTATR